MGIKEFLENLSSRMNISTQVKNIKSNNVIDSPNANIQGNVYGSEVVEGNKTTIIQNNNNIIVLDKSDSNNIDTANLQDDLKRIKQIPNYSYSLDAVEEYNKLLLFHYPKIISKEDYIKILISICKIYINRNEVDKIKEILYKLEAESGVNNKDVITLRAFSAFNNQEYKKALDIMNMIKWSKKDKLEYVVFQSLRYLNKQINYNEFKNSLIDGESLKKELLGENEQSIYSLISITARMANKYDDMLLFSCKAYEGDDDIYSKNKLAFNYYEYSIKDSIMGDIIVQDKINYQYLIKSKLICEEVLKSQDIIKDTKLYKDCLLLYVNILSLLGQVNEVWDNLKNVKYIDNNEELIAFGDRLKTLYSRQNNDNTKLSERELFLKEIFNLLDTQKYSEVISKIESICWNKYKEDINIHCILLECYIEQKDYKKFVSHLRKLELDEIESNLLIKVKARYYFMINEYDKAESCYIESINKYKDPDTFCLLLTLYNKMDKLDKFRKLIDKIINENAFVLEVEYKRVYINYFNFLYKNKCYDEALVLLINKCDKEKFGEENYLNACIKVYSELGDYFKAAQKLEELFIIDKNFNTLFNAANLYFRCNELDKSLEILTRLLSEKVDFLENVYALTSDVYILKNNLDKAYEYAEKAKELVKDLPKSKIHNFFVLRSLRCNKVDDGVIHITKFIEEYPKVEAGFKCIRSKGVNKEGKEELPSEIIDFFKKQGEDFNNLLKVLKSGQIGISLICKKRNDTINKIIQWKDIYNLKININNGNCKVMDREINNLSQIIIIDAFALYVLADINKLDILQKFQEVRVCNSTIEYLNLMLIRDEDKNVREILSYIDSEINIKVVPINWHNQKGLDKRNLEVFDDYIMDSLLCAKKSGYSYCYGDGFIKNLCNVINVNSTSLVSMIRSLELDNSYKIINELIKKNYNFINFTYRDMYYVAKESNFSKVDDLNEFFHISKESDINSFITQYIIFIYAIYYLNNESFEQYYKLFLKSMNDLHNRSFYYIWINSEMIRKLYNNKYERIYHLVNNSDYVRGITMQIESEYAIKAVLSLFENEKESNCYGQICMDIVDKDILESVMNIENVMTLKVKEKIKEVIINL